MILHTIIPHSLLLPTESGGPMETLPVKHATLMGRRTMEGFEIQQVLSTDPTAFLDKRLSPGAVYQEDGK